MAAEGTALKSDEGDSSVLSSAFVRVTFDAVLRCSDELQLLQSDECQVSCSKNNIIIIICCSWI